MTRYRCVPDPDRPGLGWLERKGWFLWHRVTIDTVRNIENFILNEKINQLIKDKL